MPRANTLAYVARQSFFDIDTLIALLGQAPALFKNIRLVYKKDLICAPLWLAMALYTNIGLTSIDIQGANTPTYFVQASVTKKKSFTTLSAKCSPLGQALTLVTNIRPARKTFRRENTPAYFATTLNYERKSFITLIPYGFHLPPPPPAQPDLNVRRCKMMSIYPLTTGRAYKTFFSS